MRITNLIVGSALLLLMLSWVLASGGSILYFLDIPSALFVFGGTAAGLWLSHGPIITLHAISKGLLQRDSLTNTQQQYFVGVLQTGHRVSWAMGILGTVVSLVVVMQNMDDPSKIGPGIAISMISIFYGGLLAELFFGLLRDRLACPPPSPMSSEQPPATRVDQPPTSRVLPPLGPHVATRAMMVLSIVLMMLFMYLVTISQSK